LFLASEARGQRDVFAHAISPVRGQFRFGLYGDQFHDAAAMIRQKHPIPLLRLDDQFGQIDFCLFDSHFHRWSQL
jgi:hypothetical protein